MRTASALLLAALLPGCGVPAYHRLTAALEDDETATDGGASTTASDPMSTVGEATGPISTVTTDPGSTSSVGDSDDATDSLTGATATTTTTSATTTAASDATDTTAPPDNAPPYIQWLFAEPETIHKAGPVTLTALYSDDVSEIELHLDDELLAVLGPGDFPYQHLIADASQNGDREFWIRVRDPEGLEATSMPAQVAVELPESGSPVWTLIGEDPQWAEARAIVPFAGGVAVGAYLVEKGLSTPILRRYDENLNLHWTVDPISEYGAVTGLAVDPDGNLVAVGVADKGGLRTWLAKLDEGGNLVFPTKFGKVGETATGVAVAEDGSIYVSGYVQTTDKGKFDAMLWAYNAEGGPKWFRQWDNELPQDPGFARDQAHGLAILSDGSIAIAGETWVRDEINLAFTDTRAFVRRYAPSNALLGSWVASKDPAKHSAALSIAADASGGLLLGGWSSSDPNSTTTPLSIHLDAKTTPTWFRQEVSGLGGLEAVHGITRLPAGPIVIAMTLQGVTTRDVVIRGFVEEGVQLWEYLHMPAKGDDRVYALTMGPYGALYYAGGSDQSVIITGELAP
ncbi:MAG: hypothetical protein R3B09_06535 [Nannocystaceae bacterium]